jgi:hypothetical protein
MRSTGRHFERDRAGAGVWMWRGGDFRTRLFLLYLFDSRSTDARPQLSDVAILCAPIHLRRVTVIVNLVVRVLPLVSVAEHVTTVRPMGNRLPDLGWHDTGTAPSTSS